MMAADPRLSAPLGRVAVAAAVVVAVVSVALTACSGGDAPPALKVFVFAGQSNMVGFGSQGTPLPPALASPSANAYFWVGETRSITSTPRTPNGVYGPEVSAVKRLAQRLGSPVLGVKVAVNGVSLKAVWDPSIPNGLYAAMKADVDNALHSHLAGHGPPEIAGFFWMQGESDAQDPAAAAAYGVNLRRLLDQVRSDFSSPRLPIVLGRIRAELPSTPPEADAEVRSAIDRVAASTPNVRSISTDALPLVPDGHISGPGLITLGDQFADAYMKLDH